MKFKVKNNKDLELCELNTRPDSKIYNKLIRMHSPEGGIITDTWKYALTEQEHKKDKAIPVKYYRNTNMIFDKYTGHKVYYIKDDKNNILSWAFILYGIRKKYNNKKARKIKECSVQFFTRNSARGLGLGTVCFKKCIKDIIKHKSENIYYYKMSSNLLWFKRTINKIKRENKEGKDIALPKFRNIYCL